MSGAAGSRRHVCAQCGAISEPRRGPVPAGETCRSCKRNARSLARYHARVDARPLRVCCECGSPVAAKAKRCDACKVERAREYQRSWYDAHVRWERAKAKCVVCDDEFEPHVPSQRYCSEPCRAKHKKRKPSAARGLYKYARWLKLRASQLELEPNCRFCLQLGVETRATVCDHIVPHRGDLDAFWSGPFQSLCAVHHSKDKQRIERGEG